MNAIATAGTPVIISGRQGSGRADNARAHGGGKPTPCTGHSERRNLRPTHGRSHQLACAHQQRARGEPDPQRKACAHGRRGFQLDAENGGHLRPTRLR
jgi:hypothetical protein